MRNRAKCSLCKDIIESFHATDLMYCKCNEIYIDGGLTNFKAGASDWANFIRIDDDDEEIQIKVIEKDGNMEEDTTIELPSLTRQDKLDMLKGMIDSYERLPSHAMLSPITQDDMAAALLLIYEILKN